MYFVIFCEEEGRNVLLNDAHNTFYIGDTARKKGRNVLFNDTLNTFIMVILEGNEMKYSFKVHFFLHNV